MGVKPDGRDCVGLADSGSGGVLGMCKTGRKRRRRPFSGGVESRIRMIVSWLPWTLNGYTVVAISSKEEGSGV